MSGLPAAMMETAKVFAQTRFNGDGVLPVESVDDPAAKATGPSYSGPPTKGIIGALWTDGATTRLTFRWKMVALS